MKNISNNLMDKIVSLCKRRGFIYPGSEIYGGLANSWDYGPLGVELKNNIKNLWWKRFVQNRDDIVGIDAALIMNPKVWEASGHLGAGFSDLLIECKNCHERYRIDQTKGQKCSNCAGTDFTEPKSFNILMKTYLGAIEGEKSQAYLRGETAQAMFVDFKQVLDTTQKTLPFGIAQIGKAFRNEITPGNFIFRTREFEQMEIEYFMRENEWEKTFQYWQNEMLLWIKDVGIDRKKTHIVEISDKERAHYSKRTVDFEFEFPFGQKELYGLAYRTDFDLKNHFKKPPYRDQKTNESFWPHVIEPTWGVDRTVLALLVSSYQEEDINGKKRVILKIPIKLAPFKAAVFPLLANKPQLVKTARKIYNDLRKDFSVAWDERDNIGKRYFSQDEIGTPYCITVDFDTIGKTGHLSSITVRNRDDTTQERVLISELKTYLHKKFITI